MWLIVSLTDHQIVGFFYDPIYCLNALNSLKHCKPDYFDSARLVPYYVDADEIQHYLHPIIMSCLDDHNIVIN